MLETDISSFMSQFYDAFISFVTLYINTLKNLVVFRIGSTAITAWNLTLGIIVVSIVFGLFIFVAPRMSNKGV